MTGSIISGIMSLAAAALGTGPAGLIALAVLIIGALVGSFLGIRAINNRVDARDLKDAGADAGTTAADLKDQFSRARAGLDEMERLDPPRRDDK